MQSHKDINKMPLAGLTAAYGVAYFVTLRGLPAIEAFPDLLSQIGASIGLTMLGYLVSVVLTGQLEAIPKARLIFLRWSDPLPGGEAFSRWMYTDSRIDVQEVKTKHGPLPSERGAQNRLWYKMYKAVSSDKGVEDASKHYLLCRDAYLVALIMGLLSTVALTWFGEGYRVKIAFGAANLFVCLLFWRAARLAGFRLVKQVLILNPNVEKSKPSVMRP